MLRIVGAMCLMAGALLWGLGAVGGLRRRVEVLSRLGDAMAFLEEELAFQMPPTAQLLERLSRGEPEPVSAFFARTLALLREDPERGLRQSWRRAADETLPMLKGEEREALLTVGEVLGRYDGEAQRQALRRALGQMEDFRRQAAEDVGRLGRVYLAVSVAGGLLAVIVGM